MGEGDFYKGLDSIAQKGVKALEDATPKDTGKTASSWDYVIKKSKVGASLTFRNSNVKDGANVALLIQYGHGTPQGIYIEGMDYINPALKPIFEELGGRVWKEVTGNA